MSVWHLITCEYPPQTGGVSDYTRQLAAGLAARGNQVHVWCPAFPGATAEPAGVLIHRDLGRLRPSDLRRVGDQLDRFPAPRRILVQWVPHGYGYRSMNLPFCLWLWRRSVEHGDKVEFMVHEPSLSFWEGSWRQDLVAVVHRLMTVISLRAAERVWVAIPAWEKRWQPYTLGRSIPFQWLPVPSNIPVIQDSARVQALRHRYAPQGDLLIGHFSSYNSPIASVLEPVLLRMKSALCGTPILLMGIGSEDFRKRVIQKQPELATQIQTAGALVPDDLSCHLAACDLLIQPYADGVSARRTSLMASLSHGRAIVTTSGDSTEPIWAESKAVALAPAGDASAFVALVKELCNDGGKRARMELAARRLYAECFDMSHTIAALEESSEPGCLRCAS